MNAVNPFDLSNTTTLIIGGRGAMGSAIARCAAACGFRIIIGERQPEPNSGNGDSVLFDATSEDSARAALAELGSLDHVVVAISAGASGGSIAETSPAEASQAFKRFWANYNVLHLLPGRLKPNGSVTLISGSSAWRPSPGFGLWTTMHGAIEALARAATIELAPIRVNVISPGGIGMRPDRQLAHHHGSPEDVAMLAVAAMASKAVTGALIDVDGRGAPRHLVRRIGAVRFTLTGNVAEQVSSHPPPLQ